MDISVWILNKNAMFVQFGVDVIIRYPHSEVIPSLFYIVSQFFLSFFHSFFLSLYVYMYVYIL